MDNIGIGVNELILIVLVLGAAIWTLVWKGVALWHAARNGQKGWYIALLVVNTLGILEIIYLLTGQNQSPPVAGAGAPPIDPS